LNILHLSDLHLDKESIRDQKIVLRALFEDIAAQVAEFGAFDLALFTGDLLAKGTYSDTNTQLAVREFILPLAEAAGLAPNLIFFAPGNHDVDLKMRSDIIANAQKALSSDESISKYIEEAAKLAFATGLEGYNSVVDSFDSPHCVLKNNHYRAYTINVKGVSVGIASLNSAWHATGAAADGDYGKLLVGRIQLDEVVEAIRDCQIKIALLHHPLKWLAPKDSQNTHRQLLTHFDALFHGHNHEPDAQSIAGTSNSYFVSNAGCLYQHRDYFNGYCCVRYDSRGQRWTIRAREYFEARNCFDIAPRFGPNGEAEFVRQGASNGVVVPVLPSDDFIDKLHTTVDAHLLPSLVSDIAPKTLKSIFVQPLVSRVSQRRLTAASKSEVSSLFTPLKEILQTQRSVVFLGNKDMGKTTLLYYLCSLSLEFGPIEMPPFGAYINLESVSDTRASLVDALVTFAGGAYRKSEFLELLRTGALVVCIDNVSESRPKQLKAVREFCREFGQCRFYFSMLETADYSLSPNQIPSLIRDQEIFYLHPFGRKETRLLTENWFGESADECSTKVDEVLSLLGRLNIPRSPFLISALLWIREKQTKFSPVNQAEILDALIDGVMDKLSENKDRSRIDSNIKRHFLSALAEYFHVKGSKRLATLELERFTVDYFTSKGLPSPTGPFLGELKSKGILFETGDEVAFMFDAIRAFFLSSRLHENKALLTKALSPEHFLEFGEELDYYTGRHRDQGEVVRHAIALVEQFRADAALDPDLSRFDRIQLQEGPLSGDDEGKLRRATAARPSAEERHALLDAVDEQARLRMPYEAEGFRHRRAQSSTGRYLEALSIGSAILRNSELVGDVSLKDAAYAAFSRDWCEILIAVVSSLDDSSKEHGLSDPTNRAERRDEGALQLLKGMLPLENPALANYFQRMLVPNVIISLALEAIGTAKLQLVMERHRAKDNATVEHVLDTFLATDLRLPKWTQQLDELLNSFSRNRFVCQLIFFKLFQLYMLGRLPAGDEERVRAMLGETITMMLPESRSRNKEIVKANVRGNFLKSIERRRLANRH
jgi:predicted MPP superfamily phosphohydrolase